MEKILFKWLEKVEYMLADTMPINEEDPKTLIEQKKQLKEVQRLIKWARRQKFSHESSGLNKPVVMQRSELFCDCKTDYGRYFDPIAVTMRCNHCELRAK